MRRRSGDRGSGTVLVLGLMGAVMALTGGVVAAGAAVVARHRAEAAADLAALAAASSADGSAPEDGSASSADGSEPGNGSTSVGCSAAGAVATAGGATLVQCRARVDGSVVVEVAVPVSLPSRLFPGGRALLARARARAGRPPPGRVESVRPAGCVFVNPREDVRGRRQRVIECRGVVPSPQGPAPRGGVQWS